MSHIRMCRRFKEWEVSYFMAFTSLGFPVFRKMKYKIDPFGQSQSSFWSADLLVSIPPSHLLQLHNEDDSSEASTSDQQPCTSATAQAGASSQDHSQAQASPAPAAAAEEASGSWNQGEAEVPPPPYASIDLGATAAAPGVWKRNVIWWAAGLFSILSMSNSSFFLRSNFVFPKCGCMLPKILTAAISLAVFWSVFTPESVLISMTASPHSHLARY